MSRTAALLCLVVAGLLLSGCTSPPPVPEVDVEGAAVSSFSLAELNLEIFLSVDNPYPVAIALQSVTFDVYYRNGDEWEYLAHGEQTGIPVNPGKTPVSIPVTIQNVDLLGSLLSFAERREMTLEIRGVVVPDLPGGISPKIPFTKTVTLAR